MTDVGFADEAVPLPASEAAADSSVAVDPALGLIDSLLFISCFCRMTSASESTLRFLAMRFSRDIVFMSGEN